MSEMREITTKQRAIDAEILRRAVSELDNAPRSLDVARLMYLGLHIADRIDQAFRRKKLVELRPNQPEPPEAA